MKVFDVGLNDGNRQCISSTFASINAQMRVRPLPTHVTTTDRWKMAP